MTDNRQKSPERENQTPSGHLAGLQSVGAKVGHQRGRRTGTLNKIQNPKSLQEEEEALMNERGIFRGVSMRRAATMQNDELYVCKFQNKADLHRCVSFESAIENRKRVVGCAQRRRVFVE